MAKKQEQNLVQKNTKSRKGLIFKIVIWTLTILFFGCRLIFAAIFEKKGCNVSWISDVYYLIHDNGDYFLWLYLIGIIIWPILLFYKQKKTKGVLILFGFYLLSLIGLCLFEMRLFSPLEIIVLWIIFMDSSVILSAKAKKLLWYLFYLFLGIACAFTNRMIRGVYYSCNYDIGGYALKPIIYLYPEQKIDVSVKVVYPEKFTHTYPHYTNGWFVEANPNGNLVDKATGRNLYALYWEGKEKNHNSKPTDGFVVAGKDTISFLEEKLAKLGLSDREADEFIIYWLPKLEDEKYNFIRFQTKAEQDTNMPLLIEPKPDTVIRVMMEYDDLDEPIKVQEQILPPTPVRTGFTVVEWGGTELDID